MRSIFLFVTAGLMVPFSAMARPISYPGGWMLMTNNDQQQYSTSANYSPTARDAFGVRSDYMRGDKTWLHTVTYNRLLQRWNAPGSQANIYVLGGLGMAENHGARNAAATIGIEADWESRRYYTSYENRVIEAGDVQRAFVQKARVGVAPYKADYGDVQPWFMLQVDHQPGMEHSVVVTPLVRLFTTRVLGEFGVSNRGDVMVNAMLQF